MNQKKMLLLVALALVVLLAAAYPLYNNLSQSVNTNQLEVLPQGNKPSGKPAGTNPTEPVPTEPSSAETTPAESVPTDPVVTEPVPTEPTPTVPTPTEPVPTEPTPTAPTPTEPVPTEPTPTVPTPTEPTPTVPTPTEPVPTEPAPTTPPVELDYDFTVVDGSGKKVKLSDYVGKPIVLNFWASWCGPCRSEMPEFQEVYEELGDQVQFLMVNSTTSENSIENAKSFIRDSGYTFPVLYDTRAEAVTAFGIDAFPTTYFLDENGELVARAVGAISKSLLLQGIDMITK